MSTRAKHTGGPGASPARVFAFETAWGWCGVKVTDRGLARVVIPDGYCKRELEHILGGKASDGRPAIVKLLSDYFGGKRPSFKIPVDTTARPDFEKAVYGEVAKIPYGDTVSYGEVARCVGRPGAARAVGTAMARNPVPIVIPCHRVVRSDGAPGGFSSRGGIATKKKLLAFERRRIHGREDHRSN